MCIQEAGLVFIRAYGMKMLCMPLSTELSTACQSPTSRCGCTEHKKKRKRISTPAQLMFPTTSKVDKKIRYLEVEDTDDDFALSVRTSGR